MLRLREPSPDATAIPRPQSLGAELERIRLQRRVAELEVVVRRLDVRVRALDAGHVERTGLRRAVGEFHDELERKRRRLAEITEPLVPEALFEPDAGRRSRCG